MHNSDFETVFVCVCVCVLIFVRSPVFLHSFPLFKDNFVFSSCGGRKANSLYTISLWIKRSL